MVAAVTGLGAGVGLLALVGSAVAAWLHFDGADAALQGALMTVACGGVLAYVGRQLNTGATLEGETLVIHYLLRTDRRIPFSEIAWVYLHEQQTTLLFALARDEALHLLLADGTTLQLSLAARGNRRKLGLQWLEALPQALPRAFVGFVPAAARAWSQREDDPRAWRRLVEQQDVRTRRIGA